MKHSKKEMPKEDWYVDGDLYKQINENGELQRYRIGYDWNIGRLNFFLEKNTKTDQPGTPVKIGVLIVREQECPVIKVKYKCILQSIENTSSGVDLVILDIKKLVFKNIPLNKVVKWEEIV
jgi:hypothetical protein